jgi:hypothetical protein
MCAAELDRDVARRPAPAAGTHTTSYGLKALMTF